MTLWRCVLIGCGRERATGRDSLMVISVSLSVSRKADLLLLSTSEALSLVYLDTAELDGWVSEWVAPPTARLPFLTMSCPALVSWTVRQTSRPSRRWVWPDSWEETSTPLLPSAVRHCQHLSPRWLTEGDIAIFLAVLAPWNNNVSEYENMSGNTRICIKICIQELNMYSKIAFSRIAIRTLISRYENMQFLKSTNSCTLPFHWHFSGEVHCEPPNNRLDRFQGTLSVDGQTFAVDNEQVLLRGCTIRNTQWCFGLVLYAGAQPRRKKNK